MEILMRENGDGRVCGGGYGRGGGRIRRGTALIK